MAARHDVGLTHVALVVSDVDRSIAFYERYAGMRVVHRRATPNGAVVWIGDLTRPFVIVLAQGPAREPPLGPFAHLGVACASREELDALVAQAAADGCLRRPTVDAGPPVGSYAMLSDPDGHTLELSFGQEVRFAVERASPDR
ncbi:MAG TPA: VOC family protein [Chloroflexota bacterium]|nr:VOC family protein [Chloroflexota bacterium]